MSYKLNARTDNELKPFDKGSNFISPSGDITMMEDLKVLNIAVDTIKQLYNGTIDYSIIKALDVLSSDGGGIYLKDDINNADTINIRYFNLPFDAKISKMGKMSGYQYKIQNNDIGIIILLKSFHKPNDQETSHCKIELSPKFLAEHEPKKAQKLIDDIANMYLLNATPCGVSPHICVDLQGWEMPLHMEDDIITRSKQIRTYNGIDTIEFEGFDSVLMKYGRQETLMVGSAKALQTSIYRKDLEIIKSDKVDFMHQIWDEFSLGTFDKNEKVWRFEQRFHHNVIKEFERGIGEDINSYLEVNNYLNDLWNYALNTIRYQIKDTIAPIYQFLMEDISFNDQDIRKEFKRRQKAKTDTTSITRNIGLFVGNFLAIKVRTKMSCRDLIKELQSMSVMTEIRAHLLEKNQDEGMYLEQIRQRYLQLLIASKYS